MDFDTFNGVEQTTENSCGAFALAAALMEFAADDSLLPRRLDVNDIVNINVNKYNAPSPAALAQSIYQVTGNLTLRAGATYEYNRPVNGMNPPSALVYVATTHLPPGCEVKVFFNGMAEKQFQKTDVNNPGVNKNLLDTEIDLLSKLIKVVAGPEDLIETPVQGEVQLLLVNGFVHWIVLSPAKCYDPGTGVVADYKRTPDPGNQWIVKSNGKEYAFSGIWISLKKPVP